MFHADTIQETVTRGTLATFLCQTELTHGMRIDTVDPLRNADLAIFETQQIGATAEMLQGETLPEIFAETNVLGMCPHLENAPCPQTVASPQLRVVDTELIPVVD